MEVQEKVAFSSPEKKNEGAALSGVRVVLAFFSEQSNLSSFEKREWKHLVVRLIGLEPTRLATPDPKSGASTNFATGAVFRLQKYCYLRKVQRKQTIFFVFLPRIGIFAS